MTRAWDVAVAVSLSAGAGVYVAGTLRLWNSAGAGRGIGRVNVAAAGAGLAALVVALLSPLAALKDVLLWAHMGQHELLMLVAAPLVVMGKPWLAAAWALPAAPRVRALALLQRPAVRGPWRTLTAPVVILAVHALVLWVWHVPRLFEGAMAHETAHALQHLSFFLTAALFWWALVRGRYGRGGYGAAALFVFVTAMHSGLLGALLTLARHPWYPSYDGRAHAGIDPPRGPAARRPAHVDPRRRLAGHPGRRPVRRLARRSRAPRPPPTPGPRSEVRGPLNQPPCRKSKSQPSSACSTCCAYRRA